MRLWARGDLRIPSEDEPEPEQELNKAFAAFGIKPVEDDDLVFEEEFYLWPENVPAFNLWVSLQTQWRTEQGARIGNVVLARRSGLDYVSVQICIRNMAIPKKERPWYFAAVQAMERAALHEWDKER